MAAEPQHLPHEHEEADHWHRHTPEEGMPQVEHAPHVNIRALAGTFVIILVVVVVLSGATIQLFRSTVVGARRSVEETLTLAEQQVEYRQSSVQTQSAYGWTEEGNVRIPIEQAMQKVVEQYAGDR